MDRRLRYAIVVGLAAFAASPAATSAAPPGYVHILGGRTKSGGAWELSAQRTKLEGHSAVCLDLTETFADGTTPGAGGGCAAGQLRAGQNVFPVATSSKTGDQVTSSLVAGIVVSRARTVRIRFGDGKVLRLRTHTGPRGWNHLLGSSVRWYGADALQTSTARPVHVTLYDRHRRRIGGRRIGSQR
jgi:hypothetical protein